MAQQPSYSPLVELLAERDRQIARLEARVAELEVQVQRLTVPFAKDEPKADPKPPGRKPGGGCGHRDQLLTFLEHPGLAATNWRAEQAIRPAVVMPQQEIRPE